MSSITKDNLKNAFVEVQRFFFTHKGKVDMGLAMAKSITNFAAYKTPLPLIEGAFGMANTILSSSQSIGAILNETTGWRSLDLQTIKLADVFASVLEKYPSKPIVFGSDLNWKCK